MLAYPFSARAIPITAPTAAAIPPFKVVTSSPIFGAMTPKPASAVMASPAAALKSTVEETAFGALLVIGNTVSR